MRYFLDTEFMEDGKRIELLSIGVVSEDGREFYRESREAKWRRANDWVRANVLPHLDRKSPACQPRELIARDLLGFIAPESPEFWGYYADYDWVALCQLYGTMMDLPEGWPMFCMDIKQLAVEKGDPELPPQENEHYALADARWNKLAWESLQ